MPTAVCPVTVRSVTLYRSSSAPARSRISCASLRGGGVGLRGLGDHLHDAEVGLAVRGGQRDRLDPVERGEVAPEVVHITPIGLQADDVDGDQQRGCWNSCP